MEAPALYPFFAQLRGRPVLVVGGGAVARRKSEALLAAGAEVRVGAPVLGPALSELLRSGRIQHVPGTFRDAWLDDVWLVIAATDDAEVNRRVADAATRRRLWVNVVDDVALSGFHVPALVRRGPLQIAISSGGHAPMLARHLRERIESLLDESWGLLAVWFARHRARIRARHPEVSQRRRWFARVLRGSVPQLLRRRRHEEATRALELAIDAERDPGAGSVVLAGAGPGDPGLLTLAALRALNEADVILHDRLVSDEVLALARRDAEFIDVGKRAAGFSTAQARIHALLLEHASAGRRVLRLKGGDPFVFGRGGEELEFLHAHGIRYEVIPGITAALACAAYAGVPLTHRDRSHSLRLLTAHSAKSANALDWESLASPGQTIAIYMGVSALDDIQANLLAHGGRPSLPFALVENGTRPEQRVVTGTLDRLPQLARLHGVASPALLILGDVAALADRLHWFGAAPPPLAVSRAQLPSELASAA